MRLLNWGKFRKFKAKSIALQHAGFHYCYNCSTSKASFQPFSRVAKCAGKQKFSHYCRHFIGKTEVATIS